MEVERDEYGCMYAFGNIDVELCMRRNSFRKIEKLREEVKYAYKIHIADLQEELNEVDKINI